MATKSKEERLKEKAQQAKEILNRQNLNTVKSIGNDIYSKVQKQNFEAARSSTPKAASGILERISKPYTPSADNLSFAERSAVQQFPNASKSVTHRVTNTQKRATENYMNNVLSLYDQWKSQRPASYQEAAASGAYSQEELNELNRNSKANILEQAEWDRTQRETGINDTWENALSDLSSTSSDYLKYLNEVVIPQNLNAIQANNDQVNEAFENGSAYSIEKASDQNRAIIDAVTDIYQGGGEIANAKDRALVREVFGSDLSDADVNAILSQIHTDPEAFLEKAVVDTDSIEVPTYDNSTSAYEQLGEDISSELANREAYNTLMSEAKASPTYEQDRVFKPVEAGYMSSSKQDNMDNLYMWLNDTAYRSEYDIRHADGIQYFKERGYDLMTEDELAGFNAAYANGYESAERYLSSLESTGVLNRRRAEAQVYNYTNVAENHPILSKGVTFGTTAANAVVAPIQLAAAATGLETDPNSSLYDLNRFNTTVRGTVNQMANEVTPVLGFVDNVLTSVFDNLIAVYTSKGIAGAAGVTGDAANKLVTGLTQSIMSSNSASSELFESLQNGDDQATAVMKALASGGIEALTEKYSIETLLGDPKGAWKYFAKNFLAEGSEEVASDLLNPLADKFISGITGSRTDIEKEYNNYLLQGYSEKEASDMVMNGFVKGLVYDFFAGAFAGGLGASTFIANNAYQGRQLNKNGAGNELVQIAKAMPEGSKSRKYADAVERTGSNYSTAQLYAALSEEMPTASQETLDSITAGSLARQLQSEGEEGNVDSIARSVMKVVNGQELTNEERNALVSSKRGVELMNTISSVSQRDSAEIKAYNEAYNAGFYGRESTQNMNQTYYQQGVKDAQAAEQKRLDRVGKGKAGTGSVSYIGTVLDKSGLTTRNATSLDANTLSRLESQQQDAVSAIQEIAKAVTTINFALYEGQADDTGNITVPNGMYDATSNTLYIDLNSGKNRSGQGVVEYTIMQTVGHELTHYIETNSAKGYAVYKDLVRKTLEARGQDFDALVDQKVRNAEANGISLTRDGAVYEVVADASEMMLKDTKALQQLAQQNKSLAEKVKTFVKDLLAKIRKALGKVGAQHPEAKALIEAEQYVAGLQEAWDAALVEAVETAKGGETGETWNGIPVVDKFELREPVEKKGDLIAIHNLTENKLLDTMQLGGFPMPSIAIVKSKTGHSKFGNISVIFGVETIDPQANKLNRVFGNDAWTPTFPAVEQEIDSKVLFGQRANGKALLGTVDKHLADRNSQFYNQFVGRDEINASVDTIIKQAWENEGILAEYLTEHGETTSIPQKEVAAIMDYDVTRADVYDKILETVGREDLQSMSGKELLETYGEALSAADSKLARLYFSYKNGKFPARTMLMKWLSEALKYDKAGKVRTQITTVANDYAAAEKSMREQINRDDFNNWMRNKLDSMLGEKALYNGKERYTSNGRRSFKQTHVAYTAENVVRLMKKEAESDVWSTSDAKGIMGASAKTYNNLDAIREDSWRLQQINEAQYQTIIDQANSYLQEFFLDIDAKNYVQQEEAGALLAQAGRKNLNAQAIESLFRTNGYRQITEGNAKLVRMVLDDLQNIPTGYFEAKPRRVVDFNEVRMVIASDTMSSELENALTERNIPYTTYAANDEADRLAKLNGLEDVKFSPRENGKLTQKQYESFGWVRENNVLSKQAYSALMSKYSSIKKKIATAPKTPDGYYVVETGDKFGINNHLVLIKGSETTPVIGDIYTINRDNETQIDVVRRVLYERLERTSALPYQIVAGLGEDGLADVFSRESAASYYSYAEEYAERSAGSGSKGTSGTIAQRNNRGRNAGKSGVKYSLRDLPYTQQGTDFDPERASKSKYGIDWLSAWTRWTNSKNGMSRAGYAMFSRQPDINGELDRGSMFGNTLWIYYGKDAVSAADDSFTSLLRNALERSYNNESYSMPDDLREAYENDADEVVSLFDPQDIVDSAGAYDNEDWVQWLWEEVLEPNGINAIKTKDGALVFDESLMEKHAGISKTDAVFDAFEYQQYLSEEEQRINGNRFYSPRTETEADLTRQYLESMEITDSMNESEKWLLGKYQRTQQEIAEKESQIAEQDELKAKATTNDERTKAENRAKILRDQVKRLRNAMRTMERSDGFGGLMRRSEDVVKRFMQYSDMTQATDLSDQLNADLTSLNSQLESAVKTIQSTEGAQRAMLAKGMLNEQSLTQVGKNVRATFGTRMSGKDISNRLALAYAELYATEGEQGVSSFTSVMRDLAEDVLRRSNRRYQSATLDDLRENLQGSISLTDVQKQELKNAGISQSEFKRVMSGVVNVSDNGTSLASIVSNAEYYGSGIISQIASTDSEGDMILKLYNLVSEEKAKERSFALDGMNETDSINYTMAEIMSNANIQLAVDQNTMDAIQTAMQQGSEANQKVVSKINAAMKGVRSAKITGEQLWRSAANADQTARQALEYYRAIDEQRRILEEKEIVQQLKSDAVSKLREERTIREYAQKATSRMRHIRKTVKGLNDMLLHETDYKNVPEELKAYVGDVVTTFGEKFGSMVFSGKQAKELLATYEKLRNSDSSFMQAQYDEDLASTLHALNEWAEKYQQLKESGKNRLEKAQLRILITEAVDDLVSNVKAMVKNSTETRINGRKKMFADIADSAISEMMERPDHTTYQNKLGDAATWLERAIVTGNTTPVYFFDQMGNTQFKNLFKDFQNGQEKWAFISAASKQRIQEFRQAYNYDAWSDADALTFTTQQGHEITLDKEQALWLYATWKREHANPIAATEHLTKGGFVYEGNKGTASGKGLFGQKAAEITTGNRITETDMKAVYGYLTEQEKGYADAMVNYLSTEIGALGNEISMELFGIRKYKEGYYFPYATARDQRFQKSASGGNATTDDSRIKHASFTHALTRGAATTLVMGNFTDVVANHIGQMALYSSMTLPIENMNRVLNYRFATEDGGTTTMRSLIRQKYGSNTLNYMERFLRDMNGGIRGTDKSAFQKTISLFKKSAVVASLSVSLQQTSAMLRAGAMMNYKYLLQTPANYKAEYDQLMQHSGVAIVKQMGRFDTNVGQSYNEWLLSPEESNLKLWSKARQALFLDGKDAARSRWETLVTGLPNTMDEVAWSMMWKAVKSEQADLHPDMDVNSNEFLDMCGKRFNDIAYHTQVFDSTLTRSQLMRSTNPIDQMATAFRAEPTLTLNVLYDAFFNKNIPKGERASRRVSALSAVMLSSIAAAFGSAMISAWGNDDDDRTAAEKLVRTTNENFWSNLLPWYNIPYISDIVSLMQGYDVERADMSLFQDVVNGFNKVQQWREGNTTWYRAMEEFVGSLANFLGIPAKNLMRDARRIYNMTNTRWEKPTQTGMEAALVPDSVLPFLEYDTSTTAYYERLVSAYAKGDTAKARDIETYIQTVGGKDADQIRSGVKSAVADRFEAGTMTEEEATNLLYKLYGNEKGFDKDSLYYYFDKLKDKMSGKLQEGETYSKFNDFYTAVETGKNLKAEISELTSHGTTKQSIASAITSQFKETYISLYKTNKTEASRLQARLLTAYEALGYKREDKIKDIQKWVENDERKTSK